MSVLMAEVEITRKRKEKFGGMDEWRVGEMD
jgi:hypothetical protein